MARRPPPIATIRLARSWARLLALPAVLVLAALAGIVGALLLVAPPFGFVFAALAAAPGIVGIWLATRVATMRIEVEEAAIELRWLGGIRAYALVPGPVTRVRLRGEQASSLRARSGLLGWQIGSARLRGDEPIEVVRLAPTRTAILVPTDRGRLAIAAASEPSLLDALSRAARARTRYEELVSRTSDSSDGGEREGDDEEAEEPASDGNAALSVETPPHILTGIERAMLDERLAQQRSHVESQTQLGALDGHRVDERVVATPAQEPDAVVPTADSDEPAATPAPAAEAAGGEADAGTMNLRTSTVLVLLPLAATLVLWLAATAAGRLPDAESEPGRLVALALVLAGPGSSVGALMARAWWPRLVAVVVTSGLASAVFIGRSLFLA